MEKINPSLLILDLIMPGVDGFAVVQRLRAQKQWQNLPIIILSGADITTEQRRDLDKLIEEFIDKGHFSKELITSTIKKIISPS